MIINGFDELNTPKVEVEEPEQYFRKMEISPKQRKERVETSKELADVMLFLFALLAIELKEKKPDFRSVYKSFKQRFKSVVLKHSRDDEYVESYINEFTNNIFDVTRKHMEGTDAVWWTSVDRATAIGENEANSVLNYEDMKRAEDAGYRFKQWQTEKDDKVRKDHVGMEGKKIPIGEYFALPDCVMMTPHDSVNGTPAQTENCRCSLLYTKR